MDDDAQLQRDLLLARRLKLAVRLVLYPALLGALVLALHIRHAQAGQDGNVHVVRWSGAGEGIPRAVVAVAGGEVTMADIELDLACDDGSRLIFEYTPSNLRRSGNVVRARRVDGHGADPDGSTHVYQASLELPRPRGSGAVDGVAFVADVFTYPGGRVVSCSSERLRGFTLRPG